MQQRSSQWRYALCDLNLTKDVRSDFKISKRYEWHIPRLYLPYTRSQVCQDMQDIYIPGIHFHAKSYSFLVFNECIICIGSAQWYIEACKEESFYMLKLQCWNRFSGICTTYACFGLMYLAQITCSDVTKTMRQPALYITCITCITCMAEPRLMAHNNAHKASFTDQWYMTDRYVCVTASSWAASLRARSVFKELFAASLLHL
jgi:hypothetical protein